jgi:hypothetical protein
VIGPSGVGEVDAGVGVDVSLVVMSSLRGATAGWAAEACGEGEWKGRRRQGGREQRGRERVAAGSRTGRGEGVTVRSCGKGLM